MSANACVHVAARARCCDGCVFWHRVSEIAPHARRHTTPHKAARSLPATYVQDMRRQAGGIVILPVITSEFCELDPQLVSNGPQQHNCMREKTQSVWGDMSWQTSGFPEPIPAGILTERSNHPCVLLYHAGSLGVFWVITANLRLMLLLLSGFMF